MPKKKNKKIGLEEKYKKSTAEAASKFLSDLSKKIEGEMTTLTTIKTNIKDNLVKNVGVIYDRIGVTEPEKREGEKEEEKDKKKTKEEAEEDAKRQAKGYIEINEYIMEQYRKLQTAYKKSSICKFYDEKDFFEKFKEGAKDKPECQGDTFFIKEQRNDKLKKKYYSLIDSSAQKINKLYGDNTKLLTGLDNLDEKIQTDTTRQRTNYEGDTIEKKGKKYVPLLGLYETLIELVEGEKNKQMNEKLETLTKAYDDAKKKKDTDKFSKEDRKANRKRMKKMSSKDIRAKKEKNIKDTRERKESYDKEHAEWKKNVGNTELSWLKNLKGDGKIKIGEKDNQNKYEEGVVGDIKNYLLNENSKKTWEDYEKTHFETPYSNQDLKKYLIAELNDNLKNSKEFQLVRLTINNILTENNTNKFLELLDFFADTNYSKKFKLKKGDTKINEIKVGEWKKIFEGFGNLRRVVRRKEWDINDMNVFTSNEKSLKEIGEKIKEFAHENNNKILDFAFNLDRRIPLFSDNSIKYSKEDVDRVISTLKKAAYAIGEFAKNVKLPEQEIKIKFPMWDNQENKTFKIKDVCEIIKTMQEKYAAYINLKNSTKSLFNAITTAHNAEDNKEKKMFSAKDENNDGTKYAFDTNDQKTKVDTNDATKNHYDKVVEVLNAYNAIQKPNDV